MSEITERIISRASELGLRQADLVKATGAGRTTVSTWFNNGGDPSAIYLYKIANSLKVSLEWLLVGEDEKLVSSNSDQMKLILQRLDTLERQIVKISNTP